MKGKIIVVEGTDCSGKETQTSLLVQRLRREGRKIERLSFPDYDTPTGKIVGGPYLGKSYICEGFFPEGAANVDPKVAALYYAADRRYNRQRILDLLDQGIDVILDRYVESNMGHQAGKLKDKQEKLDMMNWLESLEYDLLKLPRPDLVLFLYMPYQYTIELRNKRGEAPDEVEKDVDYLHNAEETYSMMAEKYNYDIVHCVKDERIRTIEEISDDVYSLVKNKLK